MTDLQMLGNNFRLTKDVVPLFDPKVHLYEYGSLMIMAQLHGKTVINYLTGAVVFYLIVLCF